MTFKSPHDLHGTTTLDKASHQGGWRTALDSPVERCRCDNHVNIWAGYSKYGLANITPVNIMWIQGKVKQDYFVSSSRGLQVSVLNITGFGITVVMTLACFVGIDAFYMKLWVRFRVRIRFSYFSSSGSCDKKYGQCWKICHRPLSRIRHCNPGRGWRLYPW